MTEYSGEGLCSTTKAATGRLCRDSGAAELGAHILLVGESSVLGDDLILALSGLVFEGEVRGESALRAQKLAELYRIPTLRLSLRAEISADSDGKVAILDPERGKLYVDPSIEIINAYFESSAPRPERPPQVLLLGDRPEAPLGGEFCGVVIGKEKLAGLGENAMYEYLCDVSDRHTGIRIAVELEFDDPQSFAERVRAVYRAGVWGRFSLICSGVSAPERTRECVGLLHAAFCELEAEGREFNGFIPKGMAIDTPLLLLGEPMHRMIDFFVLDYFCLAKKFADRCGVYDTLTELAVAFIEKCGDARVALSSAQPLPESVFLALCRGGGVRELYLSENAAKQMKAWI